MSPIHTLACLLAEGRVELYAGPLDELGRCGVVAELVDGRRGRRREHGATIAEAVEKLWNPPAAVVADDGVS